MDTRRLKIGSVDYSGVLKSVFELMLSSGLAGNDVLDACKRSIKRAEVQSRSRRLRQTGGLVSAALVLDAWHRDRRYLTSRGLPKAVRLLGRAPSVAALIRTHSGRGNAPGVAERLRDLGLLVPCGRGLYRPASDTAVISDRDPLVLQHAARALSTLVETVGRNVRSRNSLAPLLERVAEIPDLPRRHIADFQRFTHLQGETFLRTVNDWLEARRTRRHRRGSMRTTVRAGIHAYAYVAPARRKGLA